jgi:hypothetical protein
MLPSEELDHIVLVITEAFACGAEGRVLRGYRLLTESIQETRRLHSAWAAEALTLWETALDRFKQRFPAEWYPDQQR